jgi:hypothetical protein
MDKVDLRALEEKLDSIDATFMVYPVALYR